MRVPCRDLDSKNINFEHFLREKLRTVGSGTNKQYVLRKDQVRVIQKLLECVGDGSEDKRFQLNEASAVATRAYVSILNNASGAKSTPAGKMALAAAIMSLYNADPGLGSGLLYLLD